MSKNYSFMSNIEPTDEQLHLLMLDVISEVKIKAEKARENLKKHIESLILSSKNQHIDIH